MGRRRSLLRPRPLALRDHAGPTTKVPKDLRAQRQRQVSCPSPKLSCRALDKPIRPSEQQCLALKTAQESRCLVSWWRRLSEAQLVE